MLPLAVLIVVGGAYLSAPIAEAMIDWGWWKDDPPQRVFLKVFRRFLLLLVVPLFLWLRPWRDGGPASYGLTARRLRDGVPAVAFFVTFLTACAGVAVLLTSGWLQFEAEIKPGSAAWRFGRSLLAGLAVGIFEEWFFRGWMWRRFAGKNGVSPRRALAAAAGTAVIFGAVHAFQPGNLDADVGMDAAGAFTALGGWLSHLADPVAFGPAMIGLSLFSLLLSGVYLRTGSLWPAIAVHAAAVTVINGHGGLTQRVNPETWIETKHLYDGLIGWVLLAVGAFVCWPRGRDTLPASEPDPT